MKETHDLRHKIVPLRRAALHTKLLSRSKESERNSTSAFKGNMTESSERGSLQLPHGAGELTEGYSLSTDYRFLTSVRAVGSERSSIGDARAPYPGCTFALKDATVWFIEPRVGVALVGNGSIRERRGIPVDAAAADMPRLTEAEAYLPKYCNWSRHERVTICHPS